MENELWTEKYRPKKLGEVLGQEEAKLRLVDFLKNFSRQNKKAVLLHGASGCGKTCLAYAAAHELGLEVIEMNASDFRNKGQIDEIIGKALGQRSLFARGKIIVVDELEGITGTADRGGLQELMRLVETTNYPIIAITSKFWDKKFNSVRYKFLAIELKKLDNRMIMQKLKIICDHESLKIDSEALLALATNSMSDMRAAINDLQSIALSCKDIKKSDTIASLREKDESIMSALQLVFKSRSAPNIFDNVDMDADEIFLWLDENLPLEYSGKDLSQAYNILSLADVYRGRIRRWQHWRFLVYVYAMLTEGIASSKTKVREGFVGYKRPSRILKIWMVNQKLAKKKSIAMKIAMATHTSVKRAVKEMPFFEAVCRNKKQAQELAEQVKLEPEELEWLTSK